MTVLFLIILLILVFKMALSMDKTSMIRYNQKESLFCMLLYTVLVLLVAFRSENVGTDTLSYKYDYFDVEALSFSDLAVKYEGYWGYYSLSKVFTLLGAPLWVWFGFLEFVYITAIARFINKYSKDKLFSILVFVTAGLFLFSLAGLKQTLAMGVFLHAYIDFTEKKYLRFILLNILVYTIHPVILISNLATVFYMIRNLRCFYVIVIAFCLTLIFGGMLLMSSMVSLLGDEHFEMYLVEDDSYTMSTLFLYILVMLCTLPFLKRNLKNNDVAKVGFACSLLVCTFQYMSSFSPTLFRIGYCFLPFFMIFVPNVFAERKMTGFPFMMKMAAMAGLAFFCLYANRAFQFTFA